MTLTNAQHICRTFDVHAVLRSIPTRCHFYNHGTDMTRVPSNSKVPATANQYQLTSTQLRSINAWCRTCSLSPLPYTHAAHALAKCLPQHSFAATNDTDGLFPMYDAWSDVLNAAAETSAPTAVFCNMCVTAEDKDPKPSMGNQK